MRRALHLAVSLLAVILLLGPFDCFVAGAPNRQAADCCLKGHCTPTANSDACCRNSVPDRDQFVPSRGAQHSSKLVAGALNARTPIAIAAVDASPFASCSAFRTCPGPARHPPPRIGPKAS